MCICIFHNSLIFSSTMYIHLFPLFLGSNNYFCNFAYKSIKPKVMKKLVGTLLLFLCTIALASCNDEKHLNPITLEYEDSNVIFNNKFTLTPFTKETTPLYIKGGDGNYKITNSDESVVRANFDGIKISFQAQSLGSASIKIEDTSNNVYVLPITVKYLELSTTIRQRKYIIEGNNMTVGDRTKLEKEIAAADQTDVYIFTYKNAENTEGTVSIWNKDKENKEYEFTNEFIKLSEEDAIKITETTKLRSYNKVTIRQENNNKEILYVTANFFQLLSNTRMNNTPRPSYCYIKDLTEQYASAYPEVEHIYVIYEVIG